MPRFGVRMANTRIPTAEITVPRADYGEHRFQYTVVKRLRGFTVAHALRRANAWRRDHGDPR